MQCSGAWAGWRVTRTTPHRPLVGRVLCSQWCDDLHTHPPPVSLLCCDVASRRITEKSPAAQAQQPEQDKALDRSQLNLNTRRPARQPTRLPSPPPLALQRRCFLCLSSPDHLQSFISSPLHILYKGACTVRSGRTPSWWNDDGSCPRWQHTFPYRRCRESDDSRTVLSPLTPQHRRAKSHSAGHLSHVLTRGGLTASCRSEACPARSRASTIEVCILTVAVTFLSTFPHDVSHLLGGDRCVRTHLPLQSHHLWCMRHPVGHPSTHLHLEPLLEVHRIRMHQTRGGV